MKDIVETGEIETESERDRGVDLEIEEEADHRKETDLGQGHVNELVAEVDIIRNSKGLTIGTDLKIVSVFTIFKQMNILE